MLNENNYTFVSRLAPSPSSKLHLGNALSFLLTWGITRKNGGILVFRMDDLDERCKNLDLKKEIIEELKWLEIDWDGGIIYQSYRDNMYKEYLNTLTDKGLTYPCFCTRADLHAASAPHASDGTPVYAGTCKKLSSSEVEELRHKKNPAIRLALPNNLSINFSDLICGEFSQDLNAECGDFVLRRSDNIFAYQLTNVVDDIELGITHVIRGNDLLSSTPRQIHLRDIFDKNLPDLNFAHHPLLFDTTGRRLAKRESDKTIDQMRAEGQTPAFIRGTVAHLLGLIDEYSELSQDEFLKVIDFKKLQLTPKNIIGPDNN